MSEWKERSINRRDERNQKLPENQIPLCRRIKSKTKKKPFRIMYKGRDGCLWLWAKKAGCWSKYRTRKSAEQALKQYQDQKWTFENIDMWIEEEPK